MVLYLGIFFTMVVLYFATQSSPKSKGLLMGVMAFLGVFVGISDMLGGYDRYIYGEVFDELADRLRDGGNIFDTNIFKMYGNEFGYYLLNMFVGLFSANRYILILVVTLLIYACLYVSFKRHTNNYAFAVILFLGLWFFFSFTYLRQVLGAAIVWLSIKYVIERKLKWFLLVVLVGASFHNSAIMLLPLYYIPIRAFDKKKILIVMGVSFLFGLSGGPGALFEAYGSVIEDQRIEQNIDESGFRIAYLIEAVFFLYFILINYEEITKTKTQTVMTNAALVFCGILLFFVKSENGGRISWFYMIGVISTLTYIATYKKRVTANGIALILLSFFLYSRILTAWGVLLSPYKTFFTDGIREGDYIQGKYEYDGNYAIDKFYR